MSKGDEKEESWVGPKTMSDEMFLFADTYLRATGSNRTYKHAAMALGRYPESSCAQIGHKWSKFTAIQIYWREQEELLYRIRKAMNVRSILRMEDVAVKLHEGKEVTNLDKLIVVEDFIVKATEKSFYADDSGEGKGGGEGSANEETANTMNQLMASIHLLLGGEDDA